MAILTQEAKGALKHLPGKAIKGTARQVKKHPTVSAGVGGFAAGGYSVQRSQQIHDNPEFYDATPNKGRAENKHPQGAY